MDRLLVAVRYLMARPITLVSMLAVLVGVGALVVVDSVMNGFLEEQRAIIRGTTADVSIRIPREQRSDPGLVGQLLERTRESEGVEAAALRLGWPALWRREGSNGGMGYAHLGGFYFVQMVGIDPDADRHVSDLDQFLRDHRNELRVARPEDPLWFDARDPWWQGRVKEELRNFPLIPILFGDALARNMHLDLGEVLAVGTFGDRERADGTFPARSKKFVVCGTFTTNDMEFDLTRALVARADLAEFAGTGATADEIVVRAASGEDASALRDRLRVTLADVAGEPPVVSAWHDLKQVLLDAVENERRAMAVVLFFVVVVAAFNLVATLYMIVGEKVKDIGVLTAMGASPGHVAQLFLGCGLVVTLIGMLAGLVGGLLVVWTINPLADWIHTLTGFRLFDARYFLLQKLPTAVDAERIAWFAVGTFVCAVLFTLFPAWRAARLDAVEALRHG